VTTTQTHPSSLGRQPSSASAVDTGNAKAASISETPQPQRRRRRPYAWAVVEPSDAGVADAVVLLDEAEYNAESATTTNEEDNV